MERFQKIAAENTAKLIAYAYHFDVKEFAKAHAIVDLLIEKHDCELWEVIEAASTVREENAEQISTMCEFPLAFEAAASAAPVEKPKGPRPGCNWQPMPSHIERALDRHLDAHARYILG